METSIRTSTALLLALSLFTSLVGPLPPAARVPTGADPSTDISRRAEASFGPDLVQAASLVAPAEDAIGQPLTAEQQELVGWALSRFSEAGLDLPSVEFVFHQDSRSCYGHVGLYYRDRTSLHMCRLDKRTMLHELAHAWANEALTETARAAFVAHRGLETWNDQTVDWELRGTEHAAEIVTWSLMDRNIQVPFVETPGAAMTYRLLTIPASSPDELVSAYEVLTGRTPVFRQPSDWAARPEVMSPEAARAGR